MKSLFYIFSRFLILIMKKNFLVFFIGITIFLNGWLLAFAVPNSLVARNVLIRVSDTDNGYSKVKTPNKTLTIGTISLIAPKKNDAFLVGEKKVKIQWKPEHTSEKFIIAYWDPDKGSTGAYVNIPDGKKCGGIVSGKNDIKNTCKWDIPDSFKPSDEVKIRISDEENRAVTGESEAFTITRIEVTQPKGAETFTVGKTKEIKWAAKYIDGNIKIEYSNNGFNNPKDIKMVTASIAANVGSYKWIVPDDTGTTAKIRITSIKHPSIKGESANNFNIKDPLKIHFINIGTGACTLIECPGVNAPPMVVDCGQKGTGSGGRDKLAKTPLREDKKNNDYQVRDYVENIITTNSMSNYINPNVVISHADGDHYSIIKTVLANQTISHVWLGNIKANYKESGFDTWLKNNTNTVHENLGNNFNNSANPVGNLNCGDATTYILIANAGKTKNSKSLVLLIKYGEFSAIFTGDAENKSTDGRNTEDKASNTLTTIKNNNTHDPTYAKALNNISVLSGSHHGADTHNSNSTTWAQATKPRMLLFSAAERFSHPRCAAISEYYREYISFSGVTVPAHQLICGNTMPASRRPARRALSIPAATSISLSVSKWTGYTTALPIYTTADSGTISIEVTPEYTQADALDGTVDTFQMTFDPLWLKGTAPKAKEVLKIGERKDITWTVGYPTGDVKIEYSKDGFNSDIHLISHSTAASNKKYNWTIPDEPSTSVRIRLSDIGNARASFVTDAFTIRKWPKITSPNIGDTLKPGKTHDITWDNGPPSENVKIEYSKDGFTLDKNIIINSTPAKDGKYSWTIPADPSTSVQIRVSDVDASYVSHTSEKITIQ